MGAGLHVALPRRAVTCQRLSSLSSVNSGPHRDASPSCGAWPSARGLPPQGATPTCPGSLPVCTLACGPSPPVPTLLCSQTSPPLHLSCGRSGTQPPPPPAGFSSGLMLSPPVWPQTILTPYLQPLCVRLFLQIRLGVPSFGLFLALSHLLCHPAPAPSPGPPSLYLEGLSLHQIGLAHEALWGSGSDIPSHTTSQLSGARRWWLCSLGDDTVL